MRGGCGEVDRVVVDFFLGWLVWGMSCEYVDGVDRLFG